MELLNKIKKVHMVGIKGTGMSALAVNLKSMGISVTGSDFSESFFTDALLKKHEIKVLSPFSAKNVDPNIDLLIVSTAYNNKNPELQEAKKLGLKIITYPEMLGVITKQLKSIAVCGSHGKTTTSGALSYILSKTRYKPIVNIGSIVPQLINYKTKDPQLFVFEADEYQNKFRFFKPEIVILTNVDFDHPDFFKNKKHYASVFVEFIKRIPAKGLLVYCSDDKNASSVARYAKCKKISYGLNNSPDIKIKIVNIKPARMEFEVSKMGKFKSKLIGEHNALNLSATIICSNFLKADQRTVASAVSGFTGTKRRLELIKEIVINGHKCTIIDDYGHHPTEIKATIATIKSAYPNKTLWTVFQPHTFSRTKALFEDFSKTFTQSDQTIILDIYASKRETSGKIHSRDLVKKINSPNVYYLPDTEMTLDFLNKKIKTDSIILTIGAGNVWELVKIL